MSILYCYVVDGTTINTHLPCSIFFRHKKHWHGTRAYTDVDQPINTNKDPLHVPNGPMTRSKTKTLKEALNALVLNVSTKSELKGPL
jgi:hypothetical protein